MRKAAPFRAASASEHVTFTGPSRGLTLSLSGGRPDSSKNASPSKAVVEAILDVFDENGVDLCFEIHPSERVRWRHLRHVSRRRRPQALQHQLRRQPLHQTMHGLSRLHRRLSRPHQMFRPGRRVQPTAKQGVYGGYRDKLERAGRDHARLATARSISRRSSKLAA